MKKTSDYNFLFVVKDEHRYYFKYQAGAEVDLFFALIEVGKNPEYNLRMPDVLRLIRRIGVALRGGGRSPGVLTFKIGEGE